MRRLLICFCAGLFASGVAVAGTCGVAPNTASDQLRFVAYSLAHPQDAPECGMKVENGQIVVGAPTTNPAMTCPDMFAWKLFATAVSSEFWKSWAADQETWPGNGPQDDPGKPLPLCKSGTTSPACCVPGSADNPGYGEKRYKAKFCPYFPGDHASGVAPERFAAPLSKAHTVSFASNPSFRAVLNRMAKRYD